jgi:hypothetical protein
VSERCAGRTGGLEGGPLGPPSGVQGGGAPRVGVRGQHPRNFFFLFLGRHISGTTYYQDDIFLGPHDIRWFFGTWFFADGFLFPVKELGFWTNPGHWVRVLDATSSYMYIVL